MSSDVVEPVGMMTFRGLHEHTIDAKGRTSFPARFREVLRAGNGASDEKLIITTGIDRNLVAYPLQEWEVFEAKLSALPQFDPAVMQIKRIYVAGATEITLDRHGRLLIPPLLREYAGLERDLVWAGMVTSTELWAKDRWNEQAVASRTDRHAVAAALAGLGL